jgi:hypothetical protein
VSSEKRHYFARFPPIWSGQSQRRLPGSFEFQIQTTLATVFSGCALLDRSLVEWPDLVRNFTTGKHVVIDFCAKSGPGLPKCAGDKTLKF